MNTLQIPIKNYIPLKIYNKNILNEIYKAQQAKADEIYADIEDIKAQCFVKTATWGLDIWEEMCGIITDTTKSYEDRRSDILAKIRGSGACTEAKIKEIADVYGCDCEIEKHFDEYYFIIRFTGIGIPSNFTLFQQIISKMKPAHLGVQYEFNHNTWQYVSQFTWEDLRSYTWDEVLNSTLHPSTKILYSESNSGNYTEIEFK